MYTKRKSILFVVYIILSVKMGACQKRPRKQRNGVFSLSPEQKYNKMVYELKRLTTHWYERYSPNYGYEPYWVGGDWVQMDDKLLQKTEWPGQVLTEPLDVCGDECEYMYRRYGRLCAVVVGGYNYAYYIQDYGFWTFTSYCEMLAWNCRVRYDRKYVFLYLGSCLDQLTLYRSDHDSPFYTSSYNEYLGLRHPAFLTALSNAYSAANVTAGFVFKIEPSPHPEPETGSTV